MLEESAGKKEKPREIPLSRTQGDLVFTLCKGEMFIGRYTNPHVRRSRGGTQLDRYSSRILPPSERRWDIRLGPVYKHLTPIGVEPPL